jgi:NAD(P)-dependent dehydrogenase (short-subunit alcohol dehydrogenase family)
VLVNDFGGGADGQGASNTAADQVVADIRAAGGEALPDHHSVDDGARIVEAALAGFGRVDIVINNAGILRDAAFHKLAEDDWDAVYRVHVRGAMRVTRAAWPLLREQQYGRVLFTASAAGLYGNFGQASYGAAKLGLVGLTLALAREGAQKNVLVNAVAPVAATRLTSGAMPPGMAEALRADLVSPLCAYLCHESCRESGGMFEAGGGFFAKLRWQRAAGARLSPQGTLGPEDVAAAWADVTDFAQPSYPEDPVAAARAMLDNAGFGGG